MAPYASTTESSHILYCRHTILAHLFFGDFSLPSLLSYSSFSLPLTPLSLSLSLSFSLSLSLSLFNSHPHSLNNSLPHLSLSLILSSSLSLSLSLVSPSLSPSFPPLLSFHLRQFNLFNDLSPSPFSPCDYYRYTNSLFFFVHGTTVKGKDGMKCKQC